ncbi:hypothetical protein [Haloarcula marina]|uniref:hypothetical protein n=1 Tax=Haloarcula marina TaxID=2961574 RepID=UPI0020B648B1|nr:hypothetical protein [Halomicroarcula marina]
MPITIEGFLASLLGSSVSVEFVVLVYILGEYARLTEERTSPNQLKIYRYAGFAILAAIILTSGSAGLLAISIASSVDFVCIASTLFALQLLVLIGASIMLTHDILVNG